MFYPFFPESVNKTQVSAIISSIFHYTSAPQQWNKAININKRYKNWKRRNKAVINSECRKFRRIDIQTI